MLDFNIPKVDWVVEVWEAGRAFPRSYTLSTETHAVIKVREFSERLQLVPSITTTEPMAGTVIAYDTLSMNLVGIITLRPMHFFAPAREAFAAITGSREQPSKSFTKKK